MPRVTVCTFQKKKQSDEKLTVLTAYDTPTAQLMDEAGVDAILVGDSVGNTVMGLENTLGVTMDHMIHHCAMVSRGVKHAMVIGDMPFMSYQADPLEAIRNAGRLIAEGGAQAVKLEGSLSKFRPAIEGILNAGIPLMGHLGLTPQSVNAFGGYKVQGRSPEARERLRAEAQELAQAGCFALVLECVPADLAGEISAELSIPTIGIGAGSSCNGQVLVSHDILGWGQTRFSKTYVDVKGAMSQAFAQYVKEVQDGVYPQEEHSFQ